MKNPKKILFVHNHLSRFVKDDLDILRLEFDVIELNFSDHINAILALPIQLGKVDLVFGWFASWYTLLALLFARLLNKKSILVVGGYDTANMPEIDYGNQRGGFRKFISKWAIQLADELVVHSSYIGDELQINIGHGRDNVSVVYLGFQPDKMHNTNFPKKVQQVITVGLVNRSNYLRKGLKAFVLAAAELPDSQFILIGPWQDETIDMLRKISGPNVTFTDWIENEELVKYYRESKVYVQASLHEGFGMSVAEAMANGCIPVVTNVGSLPEVVGDTGVIIGSQNPIEIAAGIRKAIAFDMEYSLASVNRVRENFSMAKRRKKISKLVNDLVDCRSDNCKVIFHL